MVDQTTRLEIATVKAEQGSDILHQFANNAAGGTAIPTESGAIPALKDVIVDIQTEGADKISFATTIYPSTAAGIAATTNGAIFLVRTADPDEIYAVYRNNAGTAVDTGQRALSASAIQAAMDAATDAAADAEAAAMSALAQTARFIAPRTTDPTTRDNGNPLVIGDQYLNTSTSPNQNRIYGSSGWFTPDVDGPFLQNQINALGVTDTNLQTQINGKQALDATLTALAALNTVADRLIYATGVDTFALSTLTSFARTLLAGANAAAMLTTLGLGTIPFTKAYASAQQTWSAGGLLSLPHGLAVMPLLVTAEYVCITTEGGYAAGRVIQAHVCLDAAGTNYGMSCDKDATNLAVRISAGGLAILNAAGTAGLVLTPANWRIVIRGFA